jgi:tetratricopeptide (TPR) repeat protein
MSGPSLIDRLKTSRLVQVLIVYLGASWIVIEVAGELQEALQLPAWLVPVAFVLLLVGLVVMLGTAWVQSHPATDAREATGEVPDSWEVGLGDLVGHIRRGRMPHLTWGRAILGGVFALALLFGFAGAYVLLSDRGGVGAPAGLSAEEAGAGLAIVPFSTSGVDPDVYREGMITLLGTTLDGVPGLRAVDGNTVLARWDEVVGEGQRPDLAEIREVARRAGARYVLVGSAVGAGAQVGLVGDIYDVESGAKLGTARAEGPPDSLTTLVDRFSVSATRVLLAEGQGSESVHHLASLTTPSLDALLAYIEGERAYRRGSWDAALGAYERALEHDSTFALAHLRAAQVLGWSESGSPVIRRHQDAAERFADRLPARERALLAALVGVRDADADQVEEAEDAVRRYPDDPDLWNALGELQVHVGQKAMRPVEEEIDALERAVELSPDFAPYHIHVTEYRLAFEDSAAAAAAIEGERELGIDTAATAFARDHRAAFDLIYGDSVRRADALSYIEDRGPAGYLVNSLRGLLRLEAEEAFWRALYEGQSQNPRYVGEYVETLVRRGRTRAALEEFPRDTPGGALARLALFDYGMMDVDSLRGLGWGEDQAGRAFAAVQAGDTVEFARARMALDARLEEMYERRPELADDPTGPKAVLDVLDAAALWKAEGAEAAEEPMLEAYANVPGFVAEFLLWELGKLYEEMGDERQAFERYRAAAQSIPYAALRAARLADRLGETEEARRLYRELLIAWKDADPEFQPWLEEARAWLERIPG